YTATRSRKTNTASSTPHQGLTKTVSASAMTLAMNRIPRIVGLVITFSRVRAFLRPGSFVIYCIYFVASVDRTLVFHNTWCHESSETGTAAANLRPIGGPARRTRDQPRAARAGRRGQPSDDRGARARGPLPQPRSGLPPLRGVRPAGGGGVLPRGVHPDVGGAVRGAGAEPEPESEPEPRGEAMNHTPPTESGIGATDRAAQRSFLERWQARRERKFLERREITSNWFPKLR